MTTPLSLPSALPPVAVAAPRPAPRALPADAADPGLAFHRLVFARRRSGWWTPLVTGAVGIAFYFAFLVMIVVAAVVAMLLNPDVAQWVLQMTDSLEFDFADPAMLAVMLGSIVLMLPAYVLASLLINGRRLGLISSVVGRLRWRWMLLCAGVALLVFVVSTAVSLLIPADPSAGGAVLMPEDNPQLWWSLAVLIVLVPLQATAEEYVFRGYLQQAIGRWLRHPAFAILLPVPFFVLGHAYDLLGQTSVAVFAIVAGWLTWRTGGLEAGIALHVVNNLLAFLLSLAGMSDVNDSSPGVADFVFSTVVTVAYAVIVELLVRRAHTRRTLVIPPSGQATSESASIIV
ncbi:CPBP family intramembrane glutamic endopeptidase [Microbacterium fluvii]|uniref:CPBP family intramembrane glutamic endopeptidase n=1 Tax=Microbacterium fluvii TaxID=415215 RepID=A0ABW2HCH2_9MICO|nr:type II CAAX endopeptidase family protein [Microbacterium fluvii]MCU4671780.1 CPBP family intramembrane metalloprotease [Microbacterium fluvii]